MSKAQDIVDRLKDECEPLATEAADEIVRLRRLATDRLYMMEAYRSMLGEKGMKVVAGWDASGVKRVHHSWGPDAFEMTGEERAQILLDWEDAAKNAVQVHDIDSHLSPPAS